METDEPPDVNYQAQMAVEHNTPPEVGSGEAGGGGGSSSTILD